MAGDEYERCTLTHIDENSQMKKQANKNNNENVNGLWKVCLGFVIMLKRKEDKTLQSALEQTGNLQLKQYNRGSAE